MKFNPITAKKLEEKKMHEFVPKKRKRKPRYSKESDPKNPKKMNSDFLRKFKKIPRVLPTLTLLNRKEATLTGPSPAQKEDVGETRKKRKK